jgi:hypothetical protein
LETLRHAINNDVSVSTFYDDDGDAFVSMVTDGLEPVYERRFYSRHDAVDVHWESIEWAEERYPKQ